MSKTRTTEAVERTARVPERDGLVPRTHNAGDALGGFLLSESTLQELQRVYWLDADGNNEYPTT